MQKYIYARFPSETVTRSGYQVSCCCFSVCGACVIPMATYAQDKAHCRLCSSY